MEQAFGLSNDGMIIKDTMCRHCRCIVQITDGICEECGENNNYEPDEDNTNN